MPEFITMISQYIIIVLCPLILTNISHMLLVKFDLFSNSALPIHSRYFGNNKTWRGFTFVPLMNAILLTLIVLIGIVEIKAPLLLGFYLGLAYVLFELPNSFLKRKLGINPGEQHSRFKLFFSILDKMDSAFGVALIYSLLGFVNFKWAVLLFLLNSLIHAFLSFLLVITKVKKRF